MTHPKTSLKPIDLGDAAMQEIRAVVAIAQRIGFVGPIARYRIQGNRVELWDLHGRTAVADLVVPEFDPPAIKSPKRTRVKTGASNGSP